jgi:hypothetical protein
MMVGFTPLASTCGRQSESTFFASQRASLVVATILAARKLAELEDPHKLSPKKVGAVDGHSPRRLHPRSDREEAANYRRSAPLQKA